MVTPLLPTDINKFIVESMQDNNFVVEFLQGYLLNVKLKDQKVEPNSKLSDQNEQSDDTKVKKSKKKACSHHTLTLTACTMNISNTTLLAACILTRKLHLP